MKIVKMPNMDVDKFDAFLQTKLQNFNIDKSKANQYMEEMRFPVPLEERSYWKAFYLYFLNNKKIIATVIVLLFSGIVGTFYLKNGINHIESNKDKIKIDIVKPTTNTLKNDEVENANVNSTENKITPKLQKTTDNTTSIFAKRKEIKIKKNIIKNQLEKMPMPNEAKPEILEAIKNKTLLKDSIALKVKPVITKQDTVNIIW